MGSRTATVSDETDVMAQCGFSVVGLVVKGFFTNNGDDVVVVVVAFTDSGKEQGLSW